MIGQALTNVLKNAGEATETLMEKGAPFGYQPELRVRLSEGLDQAVIEIRSEEHTSELQSLTNLVCRLLLEKKKKKKKKKQRNNKTKIK